MSFLYNLESFNGQKLQDILINTKLRNHPELNIKVVNDLCLIKYTKSYLNIKNYTTLGLFRSVIIDPLRNEIVCFSPPKSIPFDNFVKNNTLEHCNLTKFHEGTMINLFFNKYTSEWEIATRSNIGGNYKFYKDTKSTFRQMFLEAMINIGLEFSMLKKNYSYSFVLQHPGNRIVVPINTMKLILTNVYMFKDFKVYEIQSSFFNTEQKEEGAALDLLGDVISPVEEISKEKYTDNIHSDEGWEKIKEDYSRMDIEYTCVGIQIYNSHTGHRTKLRNPSYEHVKRLKGNNPKIQFQYYNLRKSGKVREFLQYYPEYKSEFSKLREELHSWTNQLWENYKECFVKKIRKLDSYPFQFRPHLYKLHQLYLNTLREIGYYISKDQVIKYINDLPSARLMFAVNYNYKKNLLTVIGKDALPEQKSPGAPIS